MPTPISACGASVHTGSASGRSPSAARPPASDTVPAAITAAAVPEPPRGRSRDQGRRGHDGHHQRRLQRREAPALGQQDDEQEERAGQPGRHEAQCQLGPELGSQSPGSPALGRPLHRPGGGRRARTTGTWTAKIACQLISSVSSPPAAGPTASPTSPAAPQAPAARPCDPRLRASSSIAPAITQRAAERLQRAAGDQRGETGRDGAEQRCAGEEGQPAGPYAGRACRAAAGRDGGRRQHGERQHDVEGGQHPRHAAHRRVEAGQDLRQRQGHHGGVGQDDPDRRRPDQLTTVAGPRMHPFMQAGPDGDAARLSSRR